MDMCPNCNQAVALDATRCPRCGLPRNLPVFDEQGTYLGTGFAQQAHATTPDRPPTAPPVGVDHGLSTTMTPRRRRSGLMIFLTVCGGAVLLGVVAAVLVHQVVYAPREQVSGGPGESAAPTPGSPSPAAPGSPVPSATRSPTPSPTPEADYPAVFEEVASGAVQVLASTCDGAGIGSGFLVADRTVITTYHAVAGAVSVVVRVGTEVTRASVLGGRQERGIAVLRLDEALDGHVFELAAEWPLASGDGYGSVGVDATAQHPALTEGRVVALDAETNDGGVTLTGLVGLDADHEPGFAGGPVLDGDGRVIAAMLGSAGQRDALAVPVERWTELVSDPGEVPEGSCGRPLGPDLPVEITGDRASDLEHYFTAINAGDYDAAYRHLGPAIRESTSKKEAAAGWVSTYDFNIETRKGPQGKVWVTFDSIFAEGNGPEGLTCARWSLDYALEGSGEDTVINTAVPHDGDPFEPC